MSARGSTAGGEAVAEPDATAIPTEAAAPQQEVAAVSPPEVHAEPEAASAPEDAAQEPAPAAAALDEAVPEEPVKTQAEAGEEEGAAAAEGEQEDDAQVSVYAPPGDRGKAESARTLTADSLSRPSRAPSSAPEEQHNVFQDSEADRLTAAAALLTPNTALSLFRRGGCNSHTNRMETGSYSRYLLSTDHMTPLVLHDTFSGAQPTLGIMPRVTAKTGHTLYDRRHTKGTFANYLQDHQRPASRVTAGQQTIVGRLTPPRSPTPTSSAVPLSFNGTMGTGTLRREEEMLDEDVLQGLNDTRQRRRHDPHHTASGATPDHDYVYYNHKSKGCYIPIEPPVRATILQYNHLYDYGMGTRFGEEGAGAAGSRGDVQIKRNPYASRPRSYAASKGETFRLTATQRPLQGTRVDLRSDGNGTQKEHMTSSSLRTARAVELRTLHATQCPTPRTIEEVLSDPVRKPLCTEGAPHPLVQDIARDMETGKLKPEDVPVAMQNALQEAAVHQQQLAHMGPLPVSSTRQSRTESLGQPANGVVNVMGHVSPVSAMATAAAATTTAIPTSYNNASVRSAKASRLSSVVEAGTPAEAAAVVAASSVKSEAAAEYSQRSRPASDSGRSDQELAAAATTVTPSSSLPPISRLHQA